MRISSNKQLNNKEDEKYQVFLTGTTVRVFDLEGNEKIVKYEVGEGLSEEEKEAKKAWDIVYNAAYAFDEQMESLKIKTQ